MAGALSRSTSAIKKAYRPGARRQELRIAGAYTSEERKASGRK
jgi:hypothetical protein